MGRWEMGNGDEVRGFGVGGRVNAEAEAQKHR